MNATYISSSSFSVVSDKTAEFNTGRRIQADCGGDGIKYATVVSSSYSAPNTTVVIDETSLTANLTDVLYGIIQPGAEGSLPDHAHDDSEGTGGALLDYVLWDFGSQTISGTGDIYCNDIYTSSGTVYIGDVQLTVSGGSLLVGGDPIDVEQSLLDLTDTPVAYNYGRFLKSTAGDTVWGDPQAGTTWENGEGAPSSSLADPYNYYLDTISGSVFTKTDLTFGSDQCTGGTPSASSSYADNPGSYGPQLAFDDNLGNFWSANETYGYPNWIQYQFISQKQIQKLRIYPRGSYHNRCPRDFVLKGSNTGAFSGEETDILTTTGATYTSGQWTEFEFSNTDLYLYYRIHITANNEATNFVDIAEIEMIEIDDADWELIYTPETTRNVYYGQGTPPDDQYEVDDYWINELTGDTYVRASVSGGWTDDLADENLNHYSDVATTGVPSDASDNDVNTPLQKFTYVAMDFGASVTHDVTKFRLYFGNSFAYNNVCGNGDLQGSNNSTDGTDGDWTTVLDLSLMTPPSYPGWTPYEEFTNGTNYRWYKIAGTPFDNNTVIGEWELFEYFPTPWEKIINNITTFSGLEDTPDTYEDGNYLRVTASGITTVSGIILEAPNSSEWLVQVTNSGILYTTEVV